MYIPDAYDAWEFREREKAKWLKSLPVCEHCDHPIQDENCYDIDGIIICPSCMESHYKKWTEDYCQ